MNIEIETQNNYQVIKLYGEVDLNNSRSIKLDIIKLIKSKNNIIVDFTHLQYIDSSGMASLVEAFNEARENDTEFHIAGANGSPLQVLQLTRLNTVFNLVDSVAAVSNNG
ncbi:MAG: STAS domain-containing protein [Shewanella psychromarinicola]|jgi:anti-sigma B factor antagonist|uniref:Anti-sigma factor antagonist n=2 Tax=Gammaproteobacteria TaxID=1236 RepID=A0A3N4DAD7_9GAMM|nr:MULTISPECIES: STAS domain-containing protein [Shewanella]AZG34627.1 anti-sigma factor antagonist [Shewanella psychromarinicola]MCL1083750.1 STAS domain-containing protein [Shewanella psychromarinicola]PKG79608.1 anti-sigma factor antagonist [Shewanella sp. Actino-trap-3]RPA22885.1 anti-sigma factor antagonist [Shewanella psychromarinicola]|tara:strand:- start:48009 stop:48338 length:330 start_codon:yes stop_codon:yes gene_type:complete